MRQLLYKCGETETGMKDCLNHGSWRSFITPLRRTVSSIGRK